MANSSNVVAGQDATATQHNNLRADVLSETTGHRHSGAADGGMALFGSWVSRTVDTVYLAATDLIVCATALVQASDDGIKGLTDAANPPTTVRAQAQNFTNTDAMYVSITFPVRKGDRYKVLRNPVSLAGVVVYELGIGA